MSQGNIQVAKQKNPKFRLNEDQLFQNVSKIQRPIEESGYPENSLKHKKLLRKCFTRRTKPIAKLIHLSEKIRYKSVQGQTQINRMLDKFDLDRAFLLKEKMELLWADDKSCCSDKSS